MTTTLTPPPVPPAPPSDGGVTGPVSPQPPAHRPGSRVVAILTIVLGIALILGALGTSVLAAIGTSQRGASGTLTADAVGIQSLKVDVAAADLTIVYGGESVVLDVNGAASDWRVRRDGPALVVATQRTWWSALRPFNESDTAVLTLPQSLKGSALDADLSLSAGSLRADGDFGRLDVTVSAGAMNLSGRAATLDAEVSAGRLVFDLARVDTARLKLSAGSVDGSLAGSAPSAVSVDLSAGRLALILPDDRYAVSSNASAGDIENRLRVDSTSPHRITVGVSAGYVSLRS